MGRLGTPVDLSEPDVLEDQAGLADIHEPHRWLRRPTTFGRTTGVEDLKAVFGFVEGKMAVAEDHRLSVRKAATQARQSALRRAGVMFAARDLPLSSTSIVTGKARCSAGSSTFP
jgi:hypothetical protein